MIAKQLESLLAHEAAKTGISGRSPADLVQRFQSLRGSGLLPKGRGRNAQQLSPSQVAAGILSIATEKPGFAGLVSKSLANLRPVGGPNASFEESETFGKAVEAILTRPDALKRVVEVRVSDSETYTNAHCRAAIEYYHDGKTTKAAHYVHKLAFSQLRPGAEKTFDSRALSSTIVAETIFYPRLFRQIVHELRRAASQTTRPLAFDPQEEEEAQKTERARRLGIKPGSTFLNLGVDNQVTWPSTETIVEFDGKRMILLPKTRENTTSIHIDLHGQRITFDDGATLANRFLSLLSWCNDQYAILQDGWSGSSVPTPVPKRDLGFVTAYRWIFDRKTVSSSEARRAIGIYRDGRNAEQNFLVGYAVLSYYKIIELRHKGRSETKKWFRENLERLGENRDHVDLLAAFAADCGTEKPDDYLYRACRAAVAHANKPYSYDPDDTRETKRLHVAAGVLRVLARRFIRDELKVSDCPYDGT